MNLGVGIAGASLLFWDDHRKLLPHLLYNPFKIKQGSRGTLALLQQVNFAWAFWFGIQTAGWRDRRADGAARS